METITAAANSTNLAILLLLAVDFVGKFYLELQSSVREEYYPVDILDQNIDLVRPQVFAPLCALKNQTPDEYQKSLLGKISGFLQKIFEIAIILAKRVQRLDLCAKNLETLHVYESDCCRMQPRAWNYYLL